MEIERKGISCPECPFETDYLSGMRKHTKRHKEGEFNCDKCNMPFMCKGHLTFHQRKVHGVQDFDSSAIRRCDLCPYSTLHSTDFTKHKRKHLTTNYNCRYCNYPFLNEKIMEWHTRKCRFNQNKGIADARHLIKERRKESTTEQSTGSKGERKTKFKKEYRTEFMKENRKEHKQVRRTMLKNGHRTDSMNGDRKDPKQKHRDQPRHRHSASAEVLFNNSSKSEPQASIHKESKTINYKNHGNSDINKPKHSKRHKAGSQHRSVGGDYSRRQERTVCDKDKLTITITQQDQRLANSHNNQMKGRDRKSKEKDETNSITYSKLNDVIDSDHLLSDESDTTLMSVEDVSVSASLEDALLDQEDSSFEFETVTLHLPNNVTTEAVKCLHCNFITTNTESLSEHSATHKKGKHVCMFCKIPFVQEHDLKLHITTIHGDESSTSRKEKTDNIYNNEKKDAEGIARTTKKTEHNCVFCDFMTYDFDELKEHVDGHTSSDSANSSREELDELDIKDDVVEEEINAVSCGDDELITIESNEDKEKEESECFTAVPNIAPEDLKLIDRSKHFDIDVDQEQIELDTYETVHTDDNSNEAIEDKENKGRDISVNSVNNEYEEAGLLILEEIDVEIKPYEPKKLFKKVSDQSGTKYKCLACDSDRQFNTIKCIRKHFKKHHKKLRRKVCELCPYCANPFP